MGPPLRGRLDTSQFSCAKDIPGYCGDHSNAHCGEMEVEGTDEVQL